MPTITDHITKMELAHTLGQKMQDNPVHDKCFGEYHASDSNFRAKSVMRSNSRFQ